MCSHVLLALPARGALRRNRMIPGPTKRLLRTADLAIATAPPASSIRRKAPKAGGTALTLTLAPPGTPWNTQRRQ